MAHQFTCQCGRRIEVSDEYLGRDVKCPYCEQVVTAPDPDIPEAKRTGEGQGESRTSREQQQTHGPTREPPRRNQKRNRGVSSDGPGSRAVLIFILGLLGLITGLLFLSPIALYLGSVERREPGPTHGLATAGYILGIIGTVILAITLVSCSFMMFSPMTMAMATITVVGL